MMTSISYQLVGWLQDLRAGSLRSGHRHTAAREPQPPHPHLCCSPAVSLHLSRSAGVNNLQRENKEILLSGYGT